MEADRKPAVLRYDGGRLVPQIHRPVREFPLALTVNGIELATLIASPHDLRFLVAGFLRTQGLVASLEDILALSVCEDAGAASVRIKGTVPDRLKPTLTSGCGAGISFNLPTSAPSRKASASESPAFSPGDVFTMMSELARRSEAYRAHGGIHSAAVGDGRSILLSAEDLGRHNTLDRIAGEALLRGIDLSGRILVSSGRISSEMVAKAAVLGIALIASRTSPTDMAVRMAEEMGITLIGYVRGGTFHIYAHPGRVAVRTEAKRIRGITGVILAGGASRRMGSNKALLTFQGGRLIEAVHRLMAELFEEVLVVTNTPELFDFLPCRTVPDLVPGLGPLSGVHSGLHHSASQYVFVVGCDMPFLSGDLVRHLASMAGEEDVVVPESDKGLEPLHAFYGKNALGPMEESLRAGEARLVSFFSRVRVRQVGSREVARFDPEFRSFGNINTPDDYRRSREIGTR